MLKLNHLTGFGSGAAAAVPGDVTSYSFGANGAKLQISDHADFDFADNDFTWEAFVQVASNISDSTFWIQGASHVNRNAVLQDGAGTIAWNIRRSSVNEVRIMSTGSLLTNNTWHHLAIVRDGDNYYIYLDGTDVTDSGSPDTYTVTALAADVFIGDNIDSLEPVNGYIDELRISDTARYPSGTTFTPTTTQFTSDANTLLLIHGGEAYTGALTDETTQSCVTFDGTGDYLTVPDHADWDFSTGNVTIEAWIRVTDLQTGGGIGGQWVDSNNYQGVDIGGGGDVNWYSVSGGSSLVNFSTGAVVLEDSEWHHLAFIRGWNGNANDFAITYDGVSVGTVTDASALANIASVLEIGTGFDGTNTREPIMSISEIRISDTARWTANFSGSLATERLTSDGNTLLLIHGDENGGGTAAFTDSGNTGHTVTPTGNAFLGNGGTFTDSGNTGHTVSENGQAQKETEQEFKFADDGVGYFLDGTGDYLSVPDHADWQLGGGGGSWTIDFWIRFTDCSGIHTLLTQQVTDQNDGWALQWNFSSNNVQFSNFIAGVETPNVNGSAVAKANTWHHVAVVRNVNAYSIYLDGVSVASGSDATGYVDIGEPLEIGRRSDGIRYFTGYMDEIRISDTARWTTGFTPSSTQYSSDANTLLLIHGGETKSGTTGSGATFTDSGNTGHTVTENGNAIESTGNFYKF